jgi:hypothetical protein
MKEKGFVLEKDQKRPGMKQKARFILKARGLAVNAIRVPETGISLIEEYQASFSAVPFAWRAGHSRCEICEHPDCHHEKPAHEGKGFEQVKDCDCVAHFTSFFLAVRLGFPTV